MGEFKKRIKQKQVEYADFDHMNYDDIIEVAKKEFPWDDFFIEYAKEKGGYQLGDSVDNPEHLVEVLNEYTRRRDEWFWKWFGE